MSKRLDATCTARFRLRLFHDARFRVLVPATGDYLAARSASLKILVVHKTE
jgi:hypothetical protein